MAKSSPTQQKRMRENKVREKARLKREQRQERRDEKKRAPLAGEAIDESLVTPEGEEGIDWSVEPVA
jgi:hypothetical protein